MARKKKNPLQAQLEKDVATFKKNTSLKKGYENVKRETKRAVRELTSVLDLPGGNQRSSNGNGGSKKRNYTYGKSINDLLNMSNSEFLKLTKPQMRSVVSKLADAANKRLWRFSKAGIETPAFYKAWESGGVFTTKGKDLNALRSEYMRVKGFLESKTSTQKGWKDVQSRTISTLQQSGVDVRKGDFNIMWKMYNRLKAMDPNVSTNMLKYRVLREVSDSLVDRKSTPEEIVDRIASRLDELYEEQEENINNGVSEFFEI